MLHRPLSAVILVSAVSISRVAHAGDAALAESMFREGRAQMDAGNFAAACPKLAESYTQDPATGTLLALAMCQEAAGQTATAWATYAEVASRAKQDGRPDREQAARERVQALTPRLSHLTVTLAQATAAVAGVVVKRDGITVGQAAWGAAAPVDPGDHVVEVTAPGKKDWKATVKVGPAADAQTVQVPPLEDDSAASASPAAEPAGGDTAPTGGDTGTSTEGAPLRTIGLVTGGVGLVTLGVSGYFGLRAKGLMSDSNNDGHCDANNVCDATGLSKRDSAVSSASVATITLVAGGVLTAAGVTLFLVGGPKEKGPSVARVEAAPAVGWNQAAMVVRGRF